MPLTCRNKKEGRIDMGVLKLVSLVSGQALVLSTKILTVVRVLVGNFAWNKTIQVLKQCLELLQVSTGDFKYDIVESNPGGFIVDQVALPEEVRIRQLSKKQAAPEKRGCKT